MSILSRLMGISSQNDAVKVLSPSEFLSKIEKGKVQLVDVRTAMEYRSGHIKGAKNIDIYSSNFLKAFEKFDKTKPLYLYCRSGARSRQAANQLAKIGFTEIYDLRGGILSL